MDKTKVAVDIFDKRAKEYQEKHKDVSLYGDSLDLFCDLINKGDAAILELACGPGNVTKYLLNKRPGFKILGIDLSPNMLRLAEINNPDAEFQLMDCRDILELNNKYDAIACGFCLPYLSMEEAEKLIDDATKLLNPKGVIYISTMEDDYSKSGWQKGSNGDEIYMQYHQADYLADALVRNHFKLIEIERKDYPYEDGTNGIDLILIAKLLR